LHFATKWFTEAKGPDILVSNKKNCPVRGNWLQRDKG
jgi:hypothetical protein